MKPGFHLTKIILGLLLLSACAPVTPISPTPLPPTETSVPEAAPTATFEPVQLKLGILGFMSNSPFFIAQEEGYFAEQGLEVEFVSFGTSDRDMIPAMLQGEIDVAASQVRTAAINAIAQGSPTKFVADKAFLNTAASCVVEGWVGKADLIDSGTLDSLENLRGMRITTSPGNLSEYMNDQILAEAGLLQTDVELVSLNDQLAAIEAVRGGSLELAILSEPWVTRATQDGDLKVWKRLPDYFPGFSIGTLMYGPSMLERDTEVGVRFMVAYLKAIAQYNEGKTDRNVEIISAFTQLTPEEVREVCWPSFQPDGKMDLEALDTFQQWALQKAYIDAVVPVDQLWDPQYVEAAHEILGK